jgi:biopolymer transport protein ExbD/biopolymer transport protein TolR
MFHEESSTVRRTESETDLDMTPMIDVTFLLLIFFMVTSMMQQDTQVQVPVARHGEGVSTESAIVITVASRDGEPEIYLADQPFGEPASLSEIPAYVQQGVDDPAGARRTVIIKADRELPSGFIEQIARAANQVEGIEQLYVGVEDQR